MAKKQGRVEIDIGQLQAQAVALEQLIQGYQEVLQRLEEARINIEKAIETIRALEQDREMLMPADNIGVAYFYAKPSNTDKVLVHLGVNVYAALPRDEALGKLEKRLADLTAEIEKVRGQLAAALNQYNAIASILSQVQVAARQAQQRS